jgi:hypothetical protein
MSIGDEIQQNKLSLVVVDVTANEENLFVTQEDRIEVLDLHRVFRMRRTFWLRYYDHWLIYHYIMPFIRP